MARIRTIKPEFWQDEDLASVSETARLLAIGLLNLSDDEGYFKANPKLIQSQIFPLTEPSMSIHVLLSDLSNIGYISLFDGADGKAYGRVLSFLKHQAINRPTQSKIKHLQKLTDHSLSTHGVLTAGKERKGKEQGEEGKGMESEQIYFLNKKINDEIVLTPSQEYERCEMLKTELLNSQTWLIDTIRPSGISIEEAEIYLNDFLEMIKGNQKFRESLTSIKSYFANWFNKKINDTRNKSLKNVSPLEAGIIVNKGVHEMIDQMYNKH